MVSDPHTKAAPPREPTESPAPLLRLEGIGVSYGHVRAAHGIDLEVHPGEAVALLGANGAGKSSLIQAVMGLVPAAAGRVLFAGQPITDLKSDRRAALGLSIVPEGRRVFGDLTVLENLLVGAHLERNRAERQRRLDATWARFPILHERRRQWAATLSGGEQQMLAIARALMPGPRLLLLDEPSLGLAPRLVQTIYEALQDIREQGTTLLLAEQSAHVALRLVSRAYVLETGRVVFHGSAEALAHDPAVREAYLGVGES